MKEERERTLKPSVHGLERETASGLLFWFVRSVAKGKYGEVLTSKKDPSDLQSLRSLHCSVNIQQQYVQDMECFHYKHK